MTELPSCPKHNSSYYPFPLQTCPQATNWIEMEISSFEKQDIHGEYVKTSFPMFKIISSAFNL